MIALQEFLEEVRAARGIRRQDGPGDGEGGEVRER
jgi:hypothetical protein